MDTDATSGTNSGTVRYSVPQVARMLGISERAVRKQIATGKLTAERDGNRWTITLEDPNAVPEPEPSGTDTVSGRGTEAEPIEADYRPLAAEASRRYLDELRDVWLMPLVEENGNLRERIGRLEAERDQLRQALDQAREKPANDQTHVDADNAAVAPIFRPWARLRLWWKRTY